MCVSFSGICEEGLISAMVVHSCGILPAISVMLVFVCILTLESFCVGGIGQNFWSQCNMRQQHGAEVISQPDTRAPVLIASGR